MPRFSIVIPSYKNEEYLPQCLDSVLNQTFGDWEAVVVIDGSPDNCSQIAFEYSNKDRRIKVIDKPQNEGTHLARKSGVLNSSGEYILLLDADDTLPFSALESMHQSLLNSPTQMLHYGIHVLDAGVDAEEMHEFENYINKEIEPLFGHEIIDAAFSEKSGYLQDWRITQRVYSSSLLIDAFGSMTDDRLGRAQDAYEYFVVASLAKEQITDNTVIGLDYYYGRGLNGSSGLSAESFEKSARAFQSAIDAIEDYCRIVGDPALKEPCEGAKRKLLQLLMNDWFNRVATSDKLEVASRLREIIGDQETAYELKRFSRDEAYRFWCEGIPYCGDEQFHLWNNYADEIMKEQDHSERYDALCIQVESHINDLVKLRNLGERWNSQNIRIFVAAHKEVDVFESDILQPIQVGAKNAKSYFPGMLRDDEGENISNLNSSFCELTAQYWAWKNIEADYYGFCHYRRYFNFSDTEFQENPYGEIIDAFIGEESQKKYGLDDSSIAAAIDGYDVVVTEIKDIRAMPGKAMTPLDQYEEAELLYDKDLFKVFSILRDMHPGYSEDIDAFSNGNYSCFCNMYVMKKDIFFDYCEWLFPILERFCDETDMSHYGKEALRTPGHLSERLFNIYLNHHKRIDANWNIKEVQCVHFERPDKRYPLEKFSKKSIPIVFAADNNYAPMVTTTIKSMIDNASLDHDYDIFVLSNGITYRNQEKMRKALCSDNVGLRFIDAASLIESYNLTTNNSHIGVETYFRFLVQDLLSMYDKVLYLDSDLIVRNDISKLYDVDLGDNLIGAVRDIDFLGNLNFKDGKRLEYNEKVLKMNDPYDYFQAGVLLLNTKLLRDVSSVEDWLKLATNNSYIYNDQDILNHVCEGRVKFLDPRWNVMNDCAGRVSDIFALAPVAVFEEYQEARKDPCILHYAGFEKPWKDWSCDEREEYWEYARRTSYYEDLLAILLGSSSYFDQSKRSGLASKTKYAIKKIADPVLPIGTKRREVVKKVARKVLR